MGISRREFLAAAAVGGAAGAAAGFPLPWRRLGQLRAWLPAADAPMPPLAGLLHHLGSQRLRVSTYIHRIQFAPDRPLLVAAVREEIRGWDATTGQTAFRIPYPAGYDLKNGRVTTRGTVVAVASFDSNWAILHIPFDGSPPLSRAILKISNHENSAFSADGSRAAVISPGKLHLVDGITGRELWSWPLAEEGTAESFTFSNRDRQLAIVVNKEIRLLHTETGEVQAVLRPPAGNGDGDAHLLQLTASNDGTRLACLTGSDVDTLLLWHLPQTEPRCFKVEKTGTLMGFHADDGSVFMQCWGELLQLDSTTGQVQQRIDPGPLGARTLSADGSLLAVDCNQSIFLVETSTGRLHAASADPPGTIDHLEFVDRVRLQGRLREYGGWMVWQLPSGVSQLVRAPEVKHAVPVGFAPEQQIAVYADETALHVWNLAAGTRRTLESVTPGSTPAAALGGSGKVLLGHTDDGLRLWRLPGGESVQIPSGVSHHDASSAIEVSADGTTAVATIPHANMTEQEFIVYSISERRSLWRLPAGGNVLSFKLNPAGTVLAFRVARANAEDNEYAHVARAYDLRDGVMLCDIVWPGSAGIMALSPDGRLLALMGSEHELRIYEIASGGVRLEYRLPGEASALAFSPDSAQVAVACGGGPVLILDARGLHQAPTACPGPERWSTLMERLGAADAGTGLTALQEAVGWPAESLPLLAAAVKPVPLPDLAKIRGCIERLGAPAFAERDRATRELLDCGEPAMPELRKALTGNISEEARSRAESILQGSGPGREKADLRMLRCVEAAEWIGDGRARAWLASLAAGAEGTRLTREARAALARLG